MKCPICNNEMQEGGLIIDGVAPGWVPMEQFQKKGVKQKCLMLISVSIVIRLLVSSM